MVETDKAHSCCLQRALKVASLGLPHATRSELILIIIGFVVKLLLQLRIFVNDFLYLYVSLCRDRSAIISAPPGLWHRVEHQICGSPLVDFLGFPRKIGGWLVHSYGCRS